MITKKMIMSVTEIMTKKKRIYNKKISFKHKQKPSI